MNIDASTVTINGIKYVPVSEINQQAETLDGLKYVIVRTRSAGVFAGYLKNKNEMEGDIIKARRLWYWSGAASLSQLAEQGTSKPTECKFPCEVSKIHVTEIIEVLDVTEKARQSIASVAEWKA